MRKRKKKLMQGFAILISLAVIATGIRSLIIRGDMFYNNWWGGLVFAPLTIIVGLFFYIW
jgi:hypothetical protein